MKQNQLSKKLQLSKLFQIKMLLLTQGHLKLENRKPGLNLTWPSKKIRKLLKLMKPSLATQRNNTWPIHWTKLKQSKRSQKQRLPKSRKKRLLGKHSTSPLIPLRKFNRLMRTSSDTQRKVLPRMAQSQKMLWRLITKRDKKPLGRHMVKRLKITKPSLRPPEKATPPCIKKVLPRMEQHQLMRMDKLTKRDKMPLGRHMIRKLKITKPTLIPKTKATRRKVLLKIPQLQLMKMDKLIRREKQPIGKHSTIEFKMLKTTLRPMVEATTTLTITEEKNDHYQYF